MDDARFRALLETRARNPGKILEAAFTRKRRPLLRDDGRLFIVAADHPPRGILKVGSNAHAMANRRTFLDRALTALAQPGVDGVLATPDIMEDLLLLGALDGRIAIASMNRGGLQGSVWELDDRFTAFDVPTILSSGLDGGKMLLRIDPEDARTIQTLEACAHHISALARARIVAMVEPLPVQRTADGTLEIARSADSLIRAACVAAGLGVSSAYTWLKIPVVEEMERVVAATTLPTLLLGGDPGHRAAEVFEGWKRALEFPQVRGLVAGRALLYPEDGDVARAVGTAAALVHG
jgi:DhnA family fructose-bisphosphate aldolase class Ia